MKLLKSGQGRKWLDKLENVLEPAKKLAGKSRPDQQNNKKSSGLKKYNIL